METPAQGDVILDKYTVERKLGRGGMGVVVAARHRHLGELLALKFITGMCTPEAKERFWREGRAGAQLRGQHIAHVYDMGQLPNGVPYMVMEYLRGLDLKTLLNRDGPFPFADAIRYILQACDALGEAHDAGIIHRDIKPSNLFLWDRPYGEPCIKVLDFGISKHRFHDDGTLTLTKGFLGSPQYMAPEQIASPKNVDARADIWSLGVVLYEILAGTSPFHGATIVGVINQVLADEPPSLGQLRPHLPAGLESVVKRCLRKSADDRYQQIEDLAAALVEVQEELATPRVRKRQNRPTTPDSEQLPALDVMVTRSVTASSTAGSIDVTFGSTLDPPAMPTVRLYDVPALPSASGTMDDRTVSIKPPNAVQATAMGIDTMTHRMPGKSAPDGSIVPHEVDTAELATRKNTSPLPDMRPTSDTEMAMRRKLRPSMFIAFGIVMAVCATLMLLALVLPNASSSEVQSLVDARKASDDLSAPVASAPTRADSASDESSEPKPTPLEVPVVPSASANAEKPLTSKTPSHRTTADTSKPKVPPASPAVLPAPSAITTTANKPLPEDVKPQSTKANSTMSRWND